MELYVEKETSGQYGIIDTFINETIILNTKTTYTQDITAVFKGFTNDFSVAATPNNIKMLGYFGYTEQLHPTNIQKRAKLYLNGSLYREGIITLQNTSWINGTPSLFSLEFSDGQRNLTEILGDDNLSVLSTTGGDLVWTTPNILKALQGIQTASNNVRWFVPLVSVDRVFTIDSSTGALPTDNIFYNSSKPITTENALLNQELRPSMFMSDILKAINQKYDVKIDPTPYINDITQLTDLATMCTANIAVKENVVKITKTAWDFDFFREERFDIKIKPNNIFELNYIGTGTGSAHDATFDMHVQLSKTAIVTTGSSTPLYGTDVVGSYVKNLEVWEVNSSGIKIKKLQYIIQSGAESGKARLRIRIGLDVFYPAGGNTPNTLVKPLISVFASVESLAEWKYTNIMFSWADETWLKGIRNNVQPQVEPTSVNLFKSLPEIKLIDFVKSIYTMFGYKKFKDKVLNDFYYKQKNTGSGSHKGLRVENDLTPYADLSKVTKKTNTKYDGYNLKHATSEYQQNIAFSLANGTEYGQLKYPPSGKPKTEFLIETKFTAPVFNPVKTNADTQVLTFYPFGNEPHLNDAETRYIYDTIVKEFPIFYYNGVANISVPYAFIDADNKLVKSVNKYHKITHRSNRIFTETNNYITSLFNIITGDYIDQNTLYVQDFKTFVEDTLSGKKLIHTIDLSLPNIQIQKFEDSQEIIIKETKYTVMESDISLTDGKTKLTLLNK